MKKAIFISVLICLIANPCLAQCDSIPKMREVFKQIGIDDMYPFEKGSVVHLRPRLDSESVSIIKETIAKDFFVRQTRISDKWVSDTLVLLPDEKAKIDSSLQKNLPWTNAKVINCRMGKLVEIYTKPAWTGSGFWPIYEIFEPVFLRNGTLAITYYKHDIPDHYAEVKILMKKSSKWETWKTVTTISSPTSKLHTK